MPTVLSSPRVVIVFGLGASGKSTLARALAARLGLRLVHPSGLIRQLMEGDSPEPDRSRCNDGYWESEEGMRRLSRRLRQDAPVDVEVTQILLREVDRGEVVIDSWSLPWLSLLGTKIHLRASLAVRAKRAAARANISSTLAAQRIEQKDFETRDLFLRLYGFDIFHDFEDRFHLTVDTEALTAEQVESRVLAKLWASGRSLPSQAGLGEG